MEILPFTLALIVPVLMVGGMLAALEIGFRLGRRRRAFRTDETNDEITTMVAAVLGLLGLTLAFTYSAASERLTTRRALIVEEANAIGTAYLRLDLLAPEDQPPLRALFRDYVESRIHAFDRIYDREATQAARDRGSHLQREIWGKSVAACRASPNPAASLLLLNALNAMIDITTTRDLATTTHAATIILVLLISLSLMGSLLAGDTIALKGRRSRLHMTIFALAIAATVYVVIDLEYPRVGLITLGHMDRAIVQLRDLMR